jgi:hypothetical protein
MQIKSKDKKDKDIKKDKKEIVIPKTFNENPLNNVLTEQYNESIINYVNNTKSSF